MGRVVADTGGAALEADGATTVGADAGGSGNLAAALVATGADVAAVVVEVAAVVAGSGVTLVSVQAARASAAPRQAALVMVFMRPAALREKPPSTRLTPARPRREPQSAA